MKEKQSYLEHANITVNNLEETIRFLQTAIPEFKVRGNGENNGRKWVHIGTDDTYLALNEKSSTPTAKQDYSKTGLNHLGFVISDAEALSKKMEAKGYTHSYPTMRQTHRIRVYFLDHSGNEYEFVEYLSDKAEEKNNYSD